MSPTSEFNSSFDANRSTGEDGSLAERAQGAFQDTKDVIEERPLTTLLVAGAAGIVLGAVIWKIASRNRNGVGGNLSSLERAIELARSGAVNTVHSLRRTLENEGYSLAQLNGRAIKNQLSHLMSEASRLNTNPNALYAAWKRSRT
jgi:uncharacterized protein YbjQ (UPF0145 family)